MKIEKIEKAFDGNITNDSMGTLEELEKTVELLVEGISGLIKYLDDAEIVSIDELKGNYIRSLIYTEWD